ncbi:MAG TPA: DUF5715 family protein [Pyrinomonadaceae bacterium]|nr:DUF5715 family protein [Pyrinomonadaceae bacterium]
MSFRLRIAGPYSSETVDVAGDISVGRTDLATIKIDDPGLSRVNSTFFIENDELYIVDENSTNGTFVNGERISGRPRQLFIGDRIRLGNYTTITVESSAGVSASPPGPAPAHSQQSRTSAIPNPTAAVNQPPAKQQQTGKKTGGNYTVYLIAASAALTFLILVVGGILVYYFVSNRSLQQAANKRVEIPSGSRIPVRVIDPLGGEDEDDLDDLIASWETAEKEIDANSVSDVTVASSDTEEADLNVSAALFADRQRKALEPRGGAETGIRPAGLAVPKELFGDGVIKQKLKLAEMKKAGYRQPLDFADLAEKRLNKELIEMPMAAQSYYLDVGGSASDAPFTSFAFPDNRSEILLGHPKFAFLSRLAENFSGKKYDLSNPADRKQMRIRLLRMFHPRAKPILLEIANAYFARFGRPLRVTSLTRSMDYQKDLNANNPNSFKVRGEGSLPPHTSGCAFDLARKHMTAEEQNFVMQKLAEMERAGKLDALIEYGANACFHIFIYPDGRPPQF